MGKVMLFVKTGVNAFEYVAQKGLSKFGLKKPAVSVPQRVKASEVPQSVMNALMEPPKNPNIRVFEEGIRVSDEEIARLMASAPKLSATNILKNMIKDTVRNKLNKSKAYNIIRYLKNEHKIEPSVAKNVSRSELPPDVADALYPPESKIYRYVEMGKTK